MSRTDTERDAMIAQRMRGTLTLISDPLPAVAGSTEQRLHALDIDSARNILRRVITLANAGLVPLPDRHTHGYNDLLSTPSDTMVADRHLTDVHHWPDGKSRQYGVGQLIEMHAAEHDDGNLDPEPVPQPIPPAEVEQVHALAVYIAFTAVDNRQISGNIHIIVSKPVDLQRIRDVEALIATDLLDNGGTTVARVIITGIIPLDPPRVSE